MINKELNARITLAYNHFYFFCKFYDPDFFTYKKKHTLDICIKLQEIHENKIEVLGISLPPRWGKSYIASLFSAWCLGHNPDGSIMRNSYSATLAEKFSYDVRSIVGSEKFKLIFPDVCLSKDKHAVTGWNTNKAKQVSYFCAGVGGSITGFGCNLLAILDDPLKNWQDAQSSTVIENLHSWFDSTHKSRMEKGCKQIYIQTRWTNKDIVGKLLEQGQIKPENFIIIPALNENNESNCEEINTTEFYLNEKKTLNNKIFEAIYQQNPIELVGLLFSEQKLNRFKLSELDLSVCQMITVMDTKLKGTDFFCSIVLALCKNSIYIVDVVFTQDEYSFAMPKIESDFERFKVQMAVIETNGSGVIFYNELKNKHQNISFYGKNNTTNKIIRIIFQSQFIIEKFIFRNDYKAGSDYDKFMKNIYEFNENGKNEHDDAPDCLALASEFIRTKKLIV